MREALEGTSRFLARVTEWVVIVMSFGMMGSLLLGVFFRYVVGTALSWSGELAMFLFTWMIFLAGSIGVREGFHSRLVFVRDRIPGRPRCWLEVSAHGAIILFGFLLVYSGFMYLNRTLGQISAAVQYPIEALNASALVGGFLILVHAAARIVGEIASPHVDSDHD